MFNSDPSRLQDLGPDRTKLKKQQPPFPTSPAMRKVRIRPATTRVWMCLTAATRAESCSVVSVLYGAPRARGERCNLWRFYPGIHRGKTFLALNFAALLQGQRSCSTTRPTPSCRRANPALPPPWGDAGLFSLLR